jgi:hypothetical protein
MKRKDWLGILGLVVLLGLVGMAGACNEKIDSEDESANLLSVTAADPANICVDGDGEPIDEDGDGTIGPGETFFTDVPISFTISSTLKNMNAASPFNDVVLTSVSISYTGGSTAPSRRTGITVEIPAGGSASIPLIAVSATDIPPDFPLGARGTATFVFEGEDLGGEPARVRASLPYETVDICL